MTNENISIPSSSPTILKNDARGYVLTPPAEREALLDAFEAQSSLTAPAFARERGINYQTFAGWRQRRTKQREQEQAPLSAGQPFEALNLTEVIVSTPAPQPVCSSNGGLHVELPGNSRMVLRTSAQITLAAELIRTLSNHQARQQA